MTATKDQIRALGREVRDSVDTVRGAGHAVNERLQTRLTEKLGIEATKRSGVVVARGGYLGRRQDMESHGFLTVPASEVEDADGIVIVDAAFDQFCDEWRREYFNVGVSFGPRDALPDVLVGPPDEFENIHHWADEKQSRRLQA